ncbi:hypothetical protein B0H19DRAFT_1274549 [Mycena capillaripes]|nr:hypothetical protein B0H19DRAFT_1274549 [Mycena capillaripes]
MPFPDGQGEGESAGGGRGNGDRHRWDRYARRSAPSPPPSVPPPPLLRLPLAPPLSALSAGPSPSASFARLSLTSPHLSAGARVPRGFLWVRAGTWTFLRTRMRRTCRRERGMRRAECLLSESTSAAADASASTSDARTPPPAALDPSPRVRFVEPVAVVPPEDAEVDLPPNVQSPYHDNQYNDALLIDVGAGEPYRPSPESPIPAPVSNEEVQVPPEIALRTFVEEDAFSVPAEPEAVPSEHRASPIAMLPPSHSSTSPAAPAPQPLAGQPSPPPVQPPVVKSGIQRMAGVAKLERAKEEEFGQERERDVEMTDAVPLAEAPPAAAGPSAGLTFVPDPTEDVDARGCRVRHTAQLRWRCAIRLGVLKAHEPGWTPRFMLGTKAPCTTRTSVRRRVWYCEPPAASLGAMVITHSERDSLRPPRTSGLRQLQYFGTRLVSPLVVDVVETIAR